MSLFKDFGAGIKLGGKITNNLASTDPFFGGAVGAVTGFALSGGNPLGALTGAATGAISGEQGKRQKADDKEFNTMLTSETLAEQDRIDQAGRVKDPRRKNTTLTNDTNTPSLLG